MINRIKDIERAIENLKKERSELMKIPMPIITPDYKKLEPIYDKIAFISNKIQQKENLLLELKLKEIKK